MGEASQELKKTEEDSLLGRVINDRFKIIELIARGGMGRVYKARQEPLGREVALKVLDPRYKGEEDPEFQARFFLEASTAAKLSHPNTVTVFDYGKTSDDIYFIVMELVDGPTLSQILKTQGGVEPLRAVHIAIQIARSVREAHGLGVIHRDLKPANVLITQHADENDFVKVLDFGLVKDLKENQELTQQGLFMGSPKYMSPEQIQGGQVDSRTDVYSLGVILYYMLTGKVPFEGSTQVQTLMAHIKQDVPEMVAPDGGALPEEMKQVVLKSLRKDPEERFGSMNDFILALKQASGAMGNPLSASSSISMSGEFDLSGVQRMPQTPSGGVVVTGTPADGFAAPGSVSGIGAAPVVDVDVEEPKKGKGGLVLLLLAVAVMGAGLFFFLNSKGSEDPVAENDPATGTQTATENAPETEPEVETGTEAEQPPEPEPARCTVTLRSTPPGAEVFVGDRSYGSTPASVVWVGAAAEAGREVTFRFALEGHVDASVTRTVQGETLEVEAELQPERATPMVRRPWMRPSMASMQASSSMMGGEIEVTPENYRDNPY